MTPALATAAAELCRLVAVDHDTRQQLASTGELFEGYYPRMAAVHGDNAQAAMLEDRVRALEGRPQRYGTQLDWGDEGELVPWPAVEQPATVDERRAEVGLPPLAQAVTTLRRHAAAEGQSPPTDLAARRRAARAWARSVGWVRQGDERCEPR